MPISVCDVAPAISTSHELAGLAVPSKFTALLCLVSPPQSRLVGPAGPFDQHLDLAPDEPLCPFRRPRLDQLDQPLHPLRLYRVRHLLRPISAASVSRRGEKTKVKALS